MRGFDLRSGGAGAKTVVADVPDGKTGVVATATTGLKAPITVTRDSGSAGITFAALGNRITASIAAVLAVGSSLSAIARAVQADGAGVLIPVTVTGVPGDNSVVTWKIAGNVATNATRIDRTMQMIFALPFTPVRVRAVVYNAGAANGIKVSIAPNATATATPSGGTGTLQPFTFPATSLAAPSVGSGASAVPNVMKSDWMDITALARTDPDAAMGGHLFNLRYYENATSAGNRVVYCDTPAGNGNIANFGFLCAAASSFGDFTTSAPTSWGGTVDFSPVYLEFEVEGSRKTIAWCGDSTLQGFDGQTRTRSALRLAVDDLIAAGQPLSVANYAWASATTAGATGTPPATISGYRGQLNAFIAAATKKPDILVFQPSSVNNTYAIWNAAQATYWANEIISWSVANGIKPILYLPGPRDGYDSTIEANRRAVVEAIRTAANAANVPYIDADAALTNYAVNTGGYANSVNTGDGLHPNPQGNLAIKNYPVRGALAVLTAALAA